MKFTIRKKSAVTNTISRYIDNIWKRKRNKIKKTKKKYLKKENIKTLTKNTYFSIKYTETFSMIYINYNNDVFGSTIFEQSLYYFLSIIWLYNLFFGL